jgi:uncharacterized protein YndB with AHSA1/START domain
MVDDGAGARRPAFRYREVDEPNRLVLTTGAPDQDPKDATIALEAVTFEDRDSVTEMTYRAGRSSPVSGVDGWKPMFERARQPACLGLRTRLPASRR